MAEASGVALPEKGLVKWARVSQVVSATQFRCDSLIGQGDSYYAGWSVFVSRDVGGTGAAPQGESQIATAFVSSTGLVTHPAFTALLAVGDEILILHPDIAAMGKLAGQPPASNAVVANWQAAEQTLVSIGAAATRNKVQTLMIDMSTIAGTLTIRMYHAVNGVQRQIYTQNFTVAADGPGRWTINGTVGIFDVLRVTCQSDNAADNGASIGYSYMLEAM